MKNIFLAFIFGFSSIGIFAYPVELKHSQLKGIIYLDQPDGWEVHQDIMGLPFVFFSPKENGQRSNLSFVPTSASIVMDLEGLKNDLVSYKSGKKEWAQKIGAKIDVYDPLKKYPNKYGNNVTKIGMHYTFKNKKFIETSYYIECNGRLVYSKATLLNKNADHLKKIDSIIQGVRCAD